MLESMFVLWSASDRPLFCVTDLSASVRLPDAGLKKVSSLKTPEKSRKCKRLAALQADSRLTQAVGGHAGNRIVAVLLDDVRAARDEVVVEGRAVGFVLHRSIDDAVESDALPGQSAVFDRQRKTRRRDGLRESSAARGEQREGEAASRQAAQTSLPVAGLRSRCRGGRSFLIAHRYHSIVVSLLQ